jgi:hypothetical protein
MGTRAGKPISFRLPPDAQDRLVRAAAKAGVSPGELARDWVTERLSAKPPTALAESPTPTANAMEGVRAELAAVALVLLAGLSPDLDEEGAAAVVTRYLLRGEARRYLP